MSAMRFTTRQFARKYVKEQPARLRDRMQIVPVEIWNSQLHEWQERYDVIILPGDTRPRSKHRPRRKKLSGIFCK